MSFLSLCLSEWSGINTTAAFHLFQFFASPTNISCRLYMQIFYQISSTPFCKKTLTRCQMSQSGEENQQQSQTTYMYYQPRCRPAPKPGKRPRERGWSCGSSLLLFLHSALGGFSPDTTVFPVLKTNISKFQFDPGMH